MRYVALLMLLISCSLHAETLTKHEETFINSYLTERETTLGASEYANARRFLTGTLSNQYSQALAMLYTLEGFNKGNNYYFFLAVFNRTEEGLSLIADTIVGGKGSRTLTFRSMQNALITFDSKFSIPSDSTCCPSGEGAAVFHIDSNGKLRELNVSPEMPR